MTDCARYERRIDAQSRSCTVPWRRSLIPLENTHAFVVDAGMQEGWVYIQAYI